MQRPPRSAPKEKSKDFYDDTWDGEVSDEAMEEQPQEEAHIKVIDSLVNIILFYCILITCTNSL